MYASYKAGATTKKLWRTKGKKNKGKMRKLSKPGECVSIDQIESHTPSFYGILRLFLTKRKYNCAIVFVDRYSNYYYVHLQKDLNIEETIKVKRAFEAYVR